MHLSISHQRYGKILFQHIFSFWKISKQSALLLRKIEALVPLEMRSHWIQNYVQCNANISANGRMPFPFSRCFKKHPHRRKNSPPTPCLTSGQTSESVVFSIAGYIYPCASYGYMQDNIFATTGGALCLPTQNNFPKEHVSDKQHRFSQVTLPGL